MYPLLQFLPDLPHFPTHFCLLKTHKQTNKQPKQTNQPTKPKTAQETHIVRARGMDDFKESCRHNRTEAQMKSQRLWQLTQGQHSFKPIGSQIPERCGNTISHQ